MVRQHVNGLQRLSASGTSRDFCRGSQSGCPTMEFRTLWLPKRGNAVDEYEDASAGDPARGRFAIADGATESAFAGIWARLLVEGFVRDDVPHLGRWTHWLPPLQERLLTEVGGQEMPWYAESKLEEGAFATFLGLA